MITHAKAAAFRRLAFLCDKLPRKFLFFSFSITYILIDLDLQMSLRESKFNLKERKMAKNMAWSIFIGAINVFR
jgi:hypothetical protein